MRSHKLTKLVFAIHQSDELCKYGFSYLDGALLVCRHICRGPRFPSQQTAVSAKHSSTDGDRGYQERNRMKYCCQCECAILLPKS